MKKSELVKKIASHLQQEYPEVTITEGTGGVGFLVPKGKQFVIEVREIQPIARPTKKS